MRYRYSESLSEDLLKLLDDISAYRDINNDFPERNFEKELTELERLALRLFKLKLSKYEGYSKVKVAVIGNFSSGKSSFINSILGAEVCPVKVNPTTSSVTKFVYGDSEEIFLIEENGNKKPISKEEYHLMCQHELENMEKSEAFFFEYRYPSEVLKNIELYDTPGFENPKNPNDEEITREIAINQADVILFIQDIQKGTLEEETIKKIRKLQESSGAKEWYLIFNKADTKSKSEIKEIEENFDSSDVRDLFSRIFFYSAKEVFKELKEENDESFKELKNWFTKLNAGKFEAIITKQPERSKRRFLLRKTNNLISPKDHIIEISINQDNKNLEENSSNVEEICCKFKVSTSDKKSEFLKEREKLIQIFNEISLKKDEYINKEINTRSKEYKRKKQGVLNGILRKITPELFFPKELEETLKVIELNFPFTIPKNISVDLHLNIIELILKNLLQDLEISNNYRKQISETFNLTVSNFLNLLSNREELISEDTKRAILEAFSRAILPQIIQNILQQEKQHADFKVQEIKEKIKQALNRD